MKGMSMVAVSFFLLLGATHVVAKDIAAGEAIYKKSCRACHGPTGKGLSSYPKLIGHSAEYLTDMLKKYRAGDRIGPNTPLMAPNAKKLSNADIDNIAEYIVVTFK